MQNAQVLRSHACFQPLTDRSRLRPRLSSYKRVQCAANATPTKYHFSMCTNKTCKKQGCQQVWLAGSRMTLPHTYSVRMISAKITAQVIQFAQDLALEEVEVETCGCLGEQNLLLLPVHFKQTSDAAQCLAAYSLWHSACDCLQAFILSKHHFHCYVVVTQQA